MGLDISWYRECFEIKEPLLDSDGVPKWGFRAYINSHYPERAGQIKNGAVYGHGDHGSFRAGSYGGYNDWREQLAKLAGCYEATGDDPRHAYSAGAWAATAGPFWELIHFADNEGVIGAEVSAKLAADFATFQERADHHPDEWFCDRYRVWRFAFEQAAHNGAVDFH